mmetsp:Transcript_71422/g.221665  ORF Transcript_71422/g.221665 Transcript_71422/m.221665 type:complete len:608 (-) Transcript_71422:175-1998(-)
MVRSVKAAAVVCLAAAVLASLLPHVHGLANRRFLAAMAEEELPEPVAGGPEPVDSVAEETAKAEVAAATDAPVSVSQESAVAEAAPQENAEATAAAATAAPAAAAEKQEIPVVKLAAAMDAPAKVHRTKVETTTPAPLPVSTDLVVAVQRGGTGWVRGVLEAVPGARLQLYCRDGAVEDSRCASTGSVVADDYAFLQHIVQNYDKLADVTIFTTDQLNVRVDSLPYVVNVLGSLDSRVRFKGFLAKHYFPLSPKYDQKQIPMNGELLGLCRPTKAPFGMWYLNYVNTDDWDMSHLACTTASMQHTFAASADAIRRVPKSTYEGLMEELGRCGDQLSTAAHYMERSWAALLDTTCHKEAATANLHALQTQTGIFDPAIKLVNKYESQKVDLVVAARDASLDWLESSLRNIPGAQLQLYCQGEAIQDQRCTRLEDIGTTGHAYLTHILEHWDNLADVTIFSTGDLQGDGAMAAFQHVADSLDSTPKQLAFSGFYAKDYLPLPAGYDVTTLPAGELCRPSASPYGAWYTKFVNATDQQMAQADCTAASLRGIFAVSADRIHRLPKSTYQELLREVESCGDRSSTAGLFLERSWAALFAEKCHNIEAINGL